jgi:protein phosphatase
LHLQKAITDAGTWERLKTDWLLLDCELMPWSLKAQELIRSQYAPVGAAAAAALPAAVSALQAAANRGVDMGVVLAQFKERAATIDGYNAAWARYCWETTGLEEIRLAPFHLLASEGQSWMKQNHGWHLAELARIIEKGAPILHPNRFREVDLSEASSVASAVDWWEEMTAAGWEGMVVKPWEFTVQGSRGIIQPAIKCRGREYLRIIYGPEYTRPEHLQRLRQRALRGKRSLAIREFLLGAEGIARFVRGEPIGRVHPCVFGVLALESEPVDPRL